MDQYLTCKQVAENFGVKTITVWSWVRDGKLNAIKIGKLYRITPQAVDDFINSQNSKKH